MPEPEWCNWFAGFVDGEGSFCLFTARNELRLSFCLKLRDDDIDILTNVREQLGIGYIHAEPKGRTASYRTQSLDGCLQIIDVLDERLLTKKAFDFEVWSQAVIAKGCGAPTEELLEYKRLLEAGRQYTSAPMLEYNLDKDVENAGRDVSPTRN